MTIQESLSEKVKEYESLGSRQVDNWLGFQKMPEGYALMLDSDEMYFYWLRWDGTEGVIHWDKWAIRRSALANALTMVGVKK